MGSAQAFGGVFARADRSADSFHVGHNAHRTRFGWAVKILWVMEPGTSAPVTLTGRESKTASPITFHPSNEPTSQTMILDPAHPGTLSRRQGWTEYPSLLFFPQAGCYTIRASWAGGSWEQGFGVGL